ncbi:MAG TPA: hypothetical protein VJV79_21370 [Polyangiaceae bacterium]|nr:hypothetical protein [Polyangiaceae bacterium]
MTNPREDDERPSGNQRLEAAVRPITAGPWNPLASFRKTLSATQRIELLSMKVPVLPPEDFMDTAEFQRVRAARSRRFLPLVVGISAALLLLLCVGLWSWLKVRPPLRATSPLPAAIGATAPTAIPVRLAPAPESTMAKPTPPTVAKAPPISKPPAKPPVSTAAPAARETLAPRESAPSSAPSSKLSTPPPKTNTLPNPAPAASGINFWTQPR